MKSWNSWKSRISKIQDRFSRKYKICASWWISSKPMSKWSWQFIFSRKNVIFKIAKYCDGFSWFWTTLWFSKNPKNHENGEICSIFKSRKIGFTMFGTKLAGGELVLDYFSIEHFCLYYFLNISRFFSFGPWKSWKNQWKTMVFCYISIFPEKTASWNKISMKPETLQTIPDNFW